MGSCGRGSQATLIPVAKRVQTGSKEKAAFPQPWGAPSRAPNPRVLSSAGKPWQCCRDLAFGGFLPKLEGGPVLA